MTIEELLKGKYVAAFYDHGGGRIYVDENHNIAYDNWIDVIPFLVDWSSISIIISSVEYGIHIGLEDKEYYFVNGGETLEKLLVEIARDN